MRKQYIELSGGKGAVQATETNKQIKHENKDPELGVCLVNPKNKKGV